MGRRAWIAIVLVAVVVVGAGGAAYAYDSSHKDEIAEGVTIGGVPVGGLTATEAEAKVQRELLDPLRQTLVVKFDGQKWKLPGKKLKVHAELSGAVDEALAESQDGGFPGRLARYVSGGEVEESIEP